MITVIVCTLNEQANIGRCLGPLEGWPLIVVDGGSTDRTIDIVRRLRPDATIITQTGGLLKQRIAGIAAATTDLVAFVDADDLLDDYALARSYDWLDRHDLDAVQLGFGTDQRTVISRAYSGMMAASHPPGMRLSMLGRPCILYRNLLPDQPDGVPVVTPMEDAWLNRHYLTGCRIEVGPGVTIRRQPATLREVVRKTWAYGRGDAGELRRHRDWRSTVFHLLWRYPVQRAGRAQGWPAKAMCVGVGLGRAVSCCWHLMYARKATE